MRIGELARQLDLNPKTIRYYGAIGLVPEPDRTPGGYRIYGETDRKRLRFIRTAQRFGLSLDEIAEVLAFRERGEPPCHYVAGVIARQAEEVEARVAELQRLALNSKNSKVVRRSSIWMVASRDSARSSEHRLASESDERERRQMSPEVTAIRLEHCKRKRAMPHAVGCRDGCWPVRRDLF